MSAIKAVFLDFYNTIARFDPPREWIQVQACASVGIFLTEDAVRQGYGVADDFLSRENGIKPLNTRSPSEVRDLWSRYEQILLARAGVEVDRDIAWHIFQLLREHRQGLALFDDVIPALEALTDDGCRLALLSNMDDDLERIAEGLGITRYLDFAVTSREVGAAKPHPPMFLEALRRAKVQAWEAVHVGDQYYGDVLGARGVGIHPVLLNRDGLKDDFQECPVIRTLTELPPLIAAIN